MSTAGRGRCTCEGKYFTEEDQRRLQMIIVCLVVALGVAQHPDLILTKADDMASIVTASGKQQILSHVSASEDDINKKAAKGDTRRTTLLSRLYDALTSLKKDDFFATKQGNVLGSQLILNLLKEFNISTQCNTQKDSTSISHASGFVTHEFIGSLRNSTRAMKHSDHTIRHLPVLPYLRSPRLRPKIIPQRREFVFNPLTTQMHSFSAPAPIKSKNLLSSKSFHLHYPVGLRSAAYQKMLRDMFKARKGRKSPSNLSKDLVQQQNRFERFDEEMKYPAGNLTSITEHNVTTNGRFTYEAVDNGDNQRAFPSIDKSHIAPVVSDLPSSSSKSYGISDNILKPSMISGKEQERVIVKHKNTLQLQKRKGHIHDISNNEQRTLRDEVAMPSGGASTSHLFTQAVNNRNVSRSEEKVKSMSQTRTTSKFIPRLSSFKPLAPSGTRFPKPALQSLITEKVSRVAQNTSRSLNFHTNTEIDISEPGLRGNMSSAILPEEFPVTGRHKSQKRNLLDSKRNLDMNQNVSRLSNFVSTTEGVLDENVSIRSKADTYFDDKNGRVAYKENIDLKSIGDNSTFKAHENNLHDVIKVIRHQQHHLNALNKEKNINSKPNFNVEKSIKGLQTDVYVTNDKHYAESEKIVARRNAKQGKRQISKDNITKPLIFPGKEMFRSGKNLRTDPSLSFKATYFENSNVDAISSNLTSVAERDLAPHITNERRPYMLATSISPKIKQFHLKRNFNLFQSYPKSSSIPYQHYNLKSSDKKIITPTDPSLYSDELQNDSENMNKSGSTYNGQLASSNASLNTTTNYTLFDNFLPSNIDIAHFINEENHTMLNTFIPDEKFDRNIPTSKKHRNYHSDGVGRKLAEKLDIFAHSVRNFSEARLRNIIAGINTSNMSLVSQDEANRMFQHMISDEQRSINTNSYSNINNESFNLRDDNLKPRIVNVELVAREYYPNITTQILPEKRPPHLETKLPSLNHVRRTSSEQDNMAKKNSLLPISMLPTGTSIMKNTSSAQFPIHTIAPYQEKIIHNTPAISSRLPFNTTSFGPSVGLQELMPSVAIFMEPIVGNYTNVNSTGNSAGSFSPRLHIRSREIWKEPGQSLNNQSIFKDDKEAKNNYDRVTFNLINRITNGSFEHKNASNILNFQAPFGFDKVGVVGFDKKSKSSPFGYLKSNYTQLIQNSPDSITKHEFSNPDPVAVGPFRDTFGSSKISDLNISNISQLILPGTWNMEKRTKSSTNIFPLSHQPEGSKASRSKEIDVQSTTVRYRHQKTMKNENMRTLPFFNITTSQTVQEDSPGLRSIHDFQTNFSVLRTPKSVISSNTKSKDIVKQELNRSVLPEIIITLPEEQAIRDKIVNATSFANLLSNKKHEIKNSSRAIDLNKVINATEYPVRSFQGLGNSKQNIEKRNTSTGLFAWTHSSSSSKNGTYSNIGLKHEVPSLKDFIEKKLSFSKAYALQDQHFSKGNETLVSDSGARSIRACAGYHTGKTKCLEYPNANDTVDTAPFRDRDNEDVRSSPVYAQNVLIDKSRVEIGNSTDTSNDAKSSNLLSSKVKRIFQTFQGNDSINVKSLAGDLETSRTICNESNNVNSSEVDGIISNDYGTDITDTFNIRNSDNDNKYKNRNIGYISGYNMNNDIDNRKYDSNVSNHVAALDDFTKENTNNLQSYEEIALTVINATYSTINGKSRSVDIDPNSAYSLIKDGNKISKCANEISHILCHHNENSHTTNMTTTTTATATAINKTAANIISTTPVIIISNNSFNNNNKVNNSNKNSSSSENVSPKQVSTAAFVIHAHVHPWLPPLSPLAAISSPTFHTSNLGTFPNYNESSYPKKPTIQHYMHLPHGWSNLGLSSHAVESTGRSGPEKAPGFSETQQDYTLENVMSRFKITRPLDLLKAFHVIFLRPSYFDKNSQPQKSQLWPFSASRIKNHVFGTEPLNNHRYFATGRESNNWNGDPYPLRDHYRPEFHIYPHKVQHKGPKTFQNSEMARSKSYLGNVTQIQDAGLFSRRIKGHRMPRDSFENIVVREGSSNYWGDRFNQGFLGTLLNNKRGITHEGAHYGSPLGTNTAKTINDKLLQTNPLSHRDSFSSRNSVAPFKIKARPAMSLPLQTNIIANSVFGRRNRVSYNRQIPTKITHQATHARPAIILHVLPNSFSDGLKPENIRFQKEYQFMPHLRQLQVGSSWNKAASTFHSLPILTGN
ncbi:hypothetical protein PoB_005064200 [Plakobranchus ocellatus]|uniref:Uncharacterized protein n=1 Tax=Plakobranchus ocellatus TaxID=259542 RepID=A0AAV4BYL0_9GAST|nr:hypothetical protein PoB_005064200 [Plakobranchus ocellatus]